MLPETPARRSMPEANCPVAAAMRSAACCCLASVLAFLRCASASRVATAGALPSATLAIAWTVAFLTSAVFRFPFVTPLPKRRCGPSPTGIRAWRGYVRERAQMRCARWAYRKQLRGVAAIWVYKRAGHADRLARAAYDGETGSRSSRRLFWSETGIAQNPCSSARQVLQ